MKVSDVELRNNTSKTQRLKDAGVCTREGYDTEYLL